MKLTMFHINLCAQYTHSTTNYNTHLYIPNCSNVLLSTVCIVPLAEPLVYHYRVVWHPPPVLQGVGLRAWQGVGLRAGQRVG